MDYDSYVMSYEACFHDQAVQYEGVRKLRCLWDIDIRTMLNRGAPLSNRVMRTSLLWWAGSYGRHRYAPEIGKVLCCEMNTLKILDPADWQPIKYSTVLCVVCDQL